MIGNTDWPVVENDDMFEVSEAARCPFGPRTLSSTPHFQPRDLQSRHGSSSEPYSH